MEETKTIQYTGAKGHEKLMTTSWKTHWVMSWIVFGHLRLCIIFTLRVFMVERYLMKIPETVMTNCSENVLKRL